MLPPTKPSFKQLQMLTNKVMTLQSQSLMRISKLVEPSHVIELHEAGEQLMPAE